MFLFKEKNPSQHSMFSKHLYSMDTTRDVIWTLKRRYTDVGSRVKIPDNETSRCVESVLKKVRTSQLTLSSASMIFNIDVHCSTFCKNEKKIIL